MYKLEVAKYNEETDQIGPEWMLAEEEHEFDDFEQVIFLFSEHGDSSLEKEYKIVNDYLYSKVTDEDGDSWWHVYRLVKIEEEDE